MSTTKLFLSVFLAIVLGGLCLIGGLGAVLSGRDTPTLAQPIVVPPKNTVAPPTAKPYVAPTVSVMTVGEWADAMMPPLQVIMDEYANLEVYSVAMANDPLNSGYEPLFASSFAAIETECRRIGRLNTPSSVALSHNELLAFCDDNAKAGAAIARYFVTWDLPPLEESMSWLTKATAHLSTAVEAMPN